MAMTDAALAMLVRMNEAEKATGRGSWAWDLSTDRATWSAGMYHLFGVDPEVFENTNENFLRMVHPDDRGRMQEAMAEALLRSGRFLQEYRLVRPDGAVRHLRGEGRVMADERGEPTVMYGFVEDVTEREDAEAALQAANDELEAFAYSVSHDLRAPLRAMDGFARILADKHGDALDEDARHCIDMIVEGAQDMRHLVDDLLGLSRVGRKDLETEEVDPARLVEDVLADLADARLGRDVRIHVGDLPHCRGDAGLLRQVYANLVQNAIKYTRNRPDAWIEIGCTPDGAYFVRDTGIGFDMKYAKEIFHVFKRLHPANEYEGTGIGLALVSRIVSRHGGRVWAEGVVGKGATFYFRLPRRPSGPEDPSDAGGAR